MIYLALQVREVWRELPQGGESPEVVGLFPPQGLQIGEAPGPVPRSEAGRSAKVAQLAGEVGQLFEDEGELKVGFGVVEGPGSDLKNIRTVVSPQGEGEDQIGGFGRFVVAKQLLCFGEDGELFGLKGINKARLRLA